MAAVYTGSTDNFTGKAIVVSDIHDQAYQHINLCHFLLQQNT